MAKKMMVTNLRMEENDYLQAKQMAAELGMSLNEYFNYICKDSVKKALFGESVNNKKRKKSFFEAMEKIARMPNKPMGMREEDKAIYE